LTLPPSTSVGGFSKCHRQHVNNLEYTQHENVSVKPWIAENMMQARINPKIELKFYKSELRRLDFSI
jgi:hypothetical protein